MAQILPTLEELFKAGAHFGHSKSRSDARSHSFVYTYKNKISIINLEKTREMLEKTLNFLQKSAQEGKSFLFVGTKMQAKDKVKQTAEKLNSFYIIERWPGGLLTNWDVIYRTIKKMVKAENDLAEDKLDYLKKKEKVKLDKDLRKMNLVFGGLKKLEKKPDILIAIDAAQEKNSIAEAKRAGLPVVAICDTNANPREIDYPIVANDDSMATINLILDLIAETIEKNFKPKVVELKSDEANTVDPKKETQKTSAVKKEKQAKKPTTIKAEKK